jgi:hypothetical protein
MEKVVVTVWVGSRVPLVFVGIFWEFFYVRKVVFHHSVCTPCVTLAIICALCTTYVSWCI